VVDIHHAGTAMRFLTAFFAVNEGRSFDRFATHDGAPYQSFSRSTRTIGAIISYEKEVGYPPIRSRTKITASKVNIPANVSSQYISALMLVAPN
jgi:3-phosphoshikimate 1-carboxyvinyltransferase